VERSFCSWPDVGSVNSPAMDAPSWAGAMLCSSRSCKFNPNISAALGQRFMGQHQGMESVLRVFRIVALVPL
jgi:hypothetical protein